MGSLPIWSSNHGAVALLVPSVELMGRRKVGNYLMLFLKIHSKLLLVRIKTVIFISSMNKQMTDININIKVNCVGKHFFKDSLVYSLLAKVLSGARFAPGIMPPTYGWALVHPPS